VSNRAAVVRHLGEPIAIEVLAMCPACLTTVALTVAATASGGVLTAFVTKTLGLPLPRAVPAEPPKREEQR
jgi:hypothetical protein